MDMGVLGSVEVWHGGERLPVGPPLQRCVLAMLALNVGNGLSVDRLVEALWNEDGPDDARGLVHGYISRLRKVLRPAGIDIVRRSPGYDLAVDRERVDLHRFRALVAAARARPSAEDAALGLYEALALWRGDPLAGVAGSAVVDRVRAGLAQERLAVTEEWAERELELGRHREILGELTALCAEHPFQEKLVGLLMLTLHRCGRQAEALQRFEECRRLLADSLGVDPGDELRAVHERILRADAGATRPAEPDRPRRRPSTLPFDIPDFAGRAAEVDRLLETTAARGAVVTVDGMAGVGKSATAVRVAHRLAERYPDAQLFVDLHGFTPSREPVPPAAALDTLLRSVGVPAGEIPAELDHRVAAWRAEMAARRAVVVLDNALDAAQVRPLIPGAPGCVVIVTSRKRLPTLEGAVSLSLDVLPADDARALVEGVVGPAPDEQEALDELARLCGWLPLALRIVAARLRHRPQWTVSDLVRRLRSEQQRLEELRVDDHDLAAAFALSYRHLDADQQRTFRLLGVHQGADIDAHAAAALTGLPLRRAADLLDELVDHHLLEQRVRGRFGFHDLLREHAHTLLSEEDGPAQARRRLLDYYLTVADRAADTVQPGRRRVPPEVEHPPESAPAVHDYASAMAWYTAEHRNLVDAARHAGEHGFDRLAYELPRHFGNFLVIGHHIDDLVATQEPALAAVQRLNDPRAEMLSLTQIAVTYYMAGRYRLALAHSARNLDLARQLGDVSAECYALAIRTLLLQRLGDFPEAEATAAAAVAGFEQAGDYRMVAICTANQGRLRLSVGDAATAWQLLDKALARSREIGERSEEASVLSGLGAAASRLGDHPQALALLHEGLDLARSVGNNDYTVRGTIKLADGLRRAGHRELAMRTASEVVESLRHGTQLDHMATALNVLGAVQLDARQPGRALASHQDALTFATRVEYRLEQARAAEGIGRAHLHTGAPAAARSYLDQAHSHYRAMSIENTPELDADLADLR